MIVLISGWCYEEKKSGYILKSMDNLTCEHRVIWCLKLFDITLCAGLNGHVKYSPSSNTDEDMIDGRKFVMV